MRTRSMIDVQMLRVRILVDARRAQPWNGIEDARGEAWNPPGAVVPLVEEVERDTELVDPRVPERSRPIDRQHAAVRDERNVFEAYRPVDCRHELLEIAPEERLSPGEADHHRVEEPCGIGEAAQLLRFRRCRRLPVVAEVAAGVASHRHFEVHQHRATPEMQPRVLRGEERDVVWRETRREH